MQAGFDTTFAQRLAKIDLSQVIARVQKETGLDDATATRAEALYRQFLTLHHRYPGQSFVPPVVVDYVWHAHLEHTRQYMADCDLLFGSFLHHTPREDDTTADYEARTIPAYAKEFGEDILLARRLEPDYFRAGGCG